MQGDVATKKRPMLEDVVIEKSLLLSSVVTKSTTPKEREKLDDKTDGGCIWNPTRPSQGNVTMHPLSPPIPTAPPSWTQNQILLQTQMKVATAHSLGPKWITKFEKG